MNIEHLLTKTKKLIFGHTSEKKPTIIVGLSGGPDSVFLFHLLKRLFRDQIIKLIAVHIDHGWRKNSHEEALFCKNLCKQEALPFELYKNSELNIAFPKTGSQEDLGRRLRRHCFDDAYKKHQATFIALGHHRQDQQETFFIRLLRGSSLNGMRCMDEVNGHYLRPLLEIDKDDIIAYLEKNNFPYCTDQTNNEDTYLRNRIRNTVIPALKSIDSRFDQKFESTLHHLKAEDNFLAEHTIKLFATVFIQDKNLILGDLKKFKSFAETEQKRLVLHWLITVKAVFIPSDNFIKELLRFLNSPRGGSHQVNKHWIVHKKSAAFWIESII